MERDLLVVDAVEESFLRIEGRKFEQCGCLSCACECVWLRALCNIHML